MFVFFFICLIFSSVFRMQIFFLLFLLKLGSSDAEAEPEPKALTTLNSYEPVPYCANGGYCVPPVACAPWYLTSLYDSAAACYLAPGTPGVCCPAHKPSCKYADGDLKIPCSYI